MTVRAPGTKAPLTVAVRVGYRGVAIPAHFTEGSAHGQRVGADRLIRDGRRYPAAVNKVVIAPGDHGAPAPATRLPPKRERAAGARIAGGEPDPDSGERGGPSRA